MMAQAMSAFFHVLIWFLLAVASPVRGSEIAWGDVSADGRLNNRALDVPVPTVRGIDNFFVSDPMEAHDWTHVRTLNSSLNAHLGIDSAQSQLGAEKLAEFEAALQPLFSVMPKDASGHLANGTVRYALHRYFKAKHGWHVKGLEPAGGSWVKQMSVTPDVRDMSKYMMPTYLLDMLLAKDPQKIGLRQLAILAATIEHLVQVELLSILHSVYATLEVSTAEYKKGVELDDILDAYMIVYAFGVNLDVSSVRDIEKAKRHLEQNHLGWPKMKEFVRGVTEQATSTAPEGQLDFAGVLKITQRIGDDYVKWQGRDCARAKRELAVMPSLTNGRVPISTLAPSHADSYRPLFTENVEDLKKYGVLDQTNDSLTRDEQGHLIVANYINSQAMCLNTANYYTACCTNDCEDLMVQLERAAAEPTLAPEKISETMASLPGVVLGKEQLLDGARAIAATNGGRVPLHGREFAVLMHQSFPLECPSPNNQKTTNPKTPDEWMAEPNDDVQDTDDMMREIADVLSHYTSMSISSEPEHAEDEKQTGNDVIKLVDKTHIAASANPRAFSILIYMIMLVSMLGLVATIVKSGLIASGVSPDKKGIDECSFEIACLA